jgi:ligand-binding sensor domain-containing protein
MRTIILFILVIFSFQTFGQKLKYRIEHLGAENGLSQGSVYSMYKDSNGNMWFGTMDGLNFWNGKTMKVYRPSKKDPFSIDGIDIKKIIGYKVNGLLVGTENSLNIFDSETEQFKKVYFRDQKGKITKNEVFPISVSGDELKLWLGGVGLINFNFNTKRQQILVLEKSFKTNYFSNVNTTQNDAGQNIWIHGEQGLMKYSLETKKIAYFFSKNKNNLVGKNEEIVKIHIQKDNIWIGTFDGFIRFNTKTLGIKKWMFFDQKKPIGVVFDLSTDKDGNLWLGTEKNGLLFFDTQNETFEQLSNKGSFSNSKLHNDEISHVYVDNDGIVWVKYYRPCHDRPN